MLAFNIFRRDAKGLPENMAMNEEEFIDNLRLSLKAERN